MTTILAFETSTPVCSVALQTGGHSYAETQTGTGIHSEAVFVSAEKLLHRAGLSFKEVGAVVISGGPGSYTGLRIASAAVKGMLFNMAARFYAADTLASIAVGIVNRNKDGAARPQRIHAVLNARRTHLYHQIFCSKNEIGLVPQSTAAVRSLDQIAGLIAGQDVIAGTGTARLNLPESLKSTVEIVSDEAAVHAGHLIEMLVSPAYKSWVREADPEKFEPLYALPDAE